jgi:hypothetical protein
LTNQNPSFMVSHHASAAVQVFRTPFNQALRCRVAMGELYFCGCKQERQLRIQHFADCDLPGH